MSELYTKIYSIVAKIPSGIVASYGDVAKAAGLQNGARVVGWALRRLPAEVEIPWWRVINAKGYISIVNPSVTPTQQKILLEKEGVKFIVKEDLFYLQNPKWNKF
ncbi:MAG: MGMT family protein [Patescibacteria group bacterium]|jgi:methylated-DNA-protein-cysteine methyltransferase-like protein